MSSEEQTKLSLFCYLDEASLSNFLPMYVGVATSTSTLLVARLKSSLFLFTSSL